MRIWVDVKIFLTLGGKMGPGAVEAGGNVTVVETVENLMGLETA